MASRISAASDDVKRLKESFLELKKSGIQHIQDLSGDLWTDYNHHDPGITILEQTCYALTEIAYQEDLEISDLLTAFEGDEPDYESLALFLANQTFSVHPLKPADYSRMIYDQIDGVVNAWLEKADDSLNGLYTMYLNVIDIPSYNTKAEHTRIENQAKSIFNSNRNLGEDLHSVKILDYRNIDVNTQVILETSRDPSEVMAEIILKIEECITPRMQFVPLDKLIQQGRRFEEIFEGPRLINGIIPIDTYQEKPAFVDSNQVSEFILKVPDVDSVRSLFFVCNGQRYSRIDIDKGEVLGFKYDIYNVIENVQLFQKGSNRKMEVDKEQFSRYYRRMRTALRRTLPTKDLNLKPAPSKNPIQKPAPYYSIQNDFPAIYGINKFGVPTHESEVRKAQALQLKAYLYLFEQILADGMNLPHSLKNLFSVETNAASYPVTTLDDSHIPGITALYTDSHENGEPDHHHTNGDEHTHTSDTLSDIYGRFDNYIDRKSRAIDYLISLYGESCSLYSISLFNYYYSDQAYKKKLLDLKIQFLETIADLNYNRSGAFNYTVLTSDDSSDVRNESGMERKARILLGISGKSSNSRERSCHAGFELHGLKLKSTSSVEQADCYSNMSSGEVNIEINYNNRAAELFSVEVNFLDDMELSDEEGTEVLNETRIFKDGIIDDELLKSGVTLKNYSIYQPDEDGEFQVLLKSRFNSEMVYRKLGNASTAKKACDLVLAYLQRFRELSIQSEDFHVVEHVLLRPLKNEDMFVEYESEEAIEKYEKIQKERASAVKGSGEGEPNDFFSHRISILLPTWTARFSDPGYRSLVAETFNLLIPAHLVCDIYWLSPEQMCDFENRFNRWLSQKSDPRGDNYILDDLSEDLKLFIRNIEADGEEHAGQ